MLPPLIRTSNSLDTAVPATSKIVESQAGLFPSEAKERIEFGWN